MGKFLTLVGLLTQAIITSMTVTDANRQTFAIVLILVAWMALIYIVRQYLWRQDQDEATRCSIQFIGRLVPLLTILAVVLIQMLPLAIGLISYSAVTGAGYINEGIEIEKHGGLVCYRRVGHPDHLLDDNQSADFGYCYYSGNLSTQGIFRN